MRKPKNFDKNNERRHDLIVKKIKGGGLTDVEFMELEMLQEWVGHHINIMTNEEVIYSDSIDKLEAHCLNMMENEEDKEDFKQKMNEMEKKHEVSRKKHKHYVSLIQKMFGFDENWKPDKTITITESEEAELKIISRNKDFF